MRPEAADLERLEAAALLDQPQARAPVEAAVDDAHVEHDALEGVVGRIEHQRAQRRPGRPRRRGHVSDDRLEHRLHALAGARRGEEDLLPIEADGVDELLRDAPGLGERRIHLVDDGDERQVELEGLVDGRESLRLYPLRRVDHHDGALAGRERARDLVGEVDVARGVDEVELVALAVRRAEVEAHGLRLDRDPLLAFELHLVEQLLAHLARGDRPRLLQHAVGERRLAVIDVGDDRKVADAPLIHGPIVPAGRAARSRPDATRGPPGPPRSAARRPR